MIAVEYGMPTDKSAPTAQFGVSRGFFQDEGIDLALRPYYGGPAIAAALDEGRLAFAQIGTPPAIVAVSNGSRFKMVGSAIRRKAHLYLGVKRSIEKAEDLKGARLGVLSLGSCDEWIARTMIGTYGLDPERDIRFVPIKSGYARVVELIREGTIDAALAIEPNMSLGESEGVLRIWAAAYQDEYLPRFQWTVLVATTALIDREPALLAALLRAYARSARYAAENADEYADFLAESYGIHQTVSRLTVGRELPHYELDCRIDLDGLRRAIEIQTGLGGIGRPVSAADLIDLRFLPHIENEFAMCDEVR